MFLIVGISGLIDIVISGLSILKSLIVCVISSIGGDIKGTILRMPEGCGLGSYMILYALRLVIDWSLPYYVARSVSWDAEILEAEILYNFGLVKRDSGDIYIRIDYLNSMGYWDSIV